MPISGSTVVRRQLGRRLRQLRDAARKTDVDVTEASLASKTKLWRIENGKVPIKIGDVRALCWFYGVDQKTTDALATLALGTAVQGWWETYEDVLPDWFSLFIGLEAIAKHIFIYDPELVPGLLQTPDYIRGVFAATTHNNDEATIQGQIRLREQRQQALTVRTPPLRLTVIVNAAVLARPVGGRSVMDEQVTRLHDLARLDNIDIRVLPWDVGAHAAMSVGAFAILDFDDPDDPAVVYIETHTGAMYLEKPDELSEYRDIADSILKQTIPIEEYQP
jgi:hypothetical protein